MWEGFAYGLFFDMNEWESESGKVHPLHSQAVALLFEMQATQNET